MITKCFLSKGASSSTAAKLLSTIAWSRDAPSSGNRKDPREKADGLPSNNERMGSKTWEDRHDRKLGGGSGRGRGGDSGRGDRSQVQSSPINAGTGGGRGGGSGRGDRSLDRSRPSAGRATNYDRAGSSSSNSSGNKFRGRHDYDPDREPRSECGYYAGDHVYGIASARLAITRGKRVITELLVQEDNKITDKNDKKSAAELLKMANEKSIKIREFPKHDLNLLADNKPHQGFILRATPIEIENLELLEKSEIFKCVLALDELMDPQNLGALLRTSYYLGVEKVIVCGKNSAPLSPTVSKASSGALEVLEVFSTDNMMKFLEKSQLNGWQVCFPKLFIFRIMFLYFHILSNEGGREKIEAH
jgi:tRNA G18 (ribose-2'-O)-methylase SpoU